MWYRHSQNKKKTNLYPFLPEKGSFKPWFSNVVTDPKLYGSRFNNWKASQLKPSDDSAGEGGLTDWTPQRGGRTNKGITQQEYDRFRKSQNQLPRPVDYIENREVDQILHRNYWARLNAEKLKPMISVVVATYGLLAGAEDAAKALQQVISKRIPGQKITGNIYNQTIENINMLASTKQKEYELALEVLDLLEKLLDQPGMGGYKKRMQNLRTIINNMNPSLNPKMKSTQSASYTDLLEDLLIDVRQSTLQNV